MTIELANDEKSGVDVFLGTLKAALLANGESPEDLAVLASRPQSIEEIVSFIVSLREQSVCKQRQSEIRFGERLVDLRTGVVRWPDGTDQLTGLDLRLLKCLLESEREHPVSTSELLEKLWGGAVATEVVAMAIRRLRKRLDDHGERIISIYGKGYTACPDT